MIKGGYYIKARKIQDSAIAHAPPHVREIWEYFIKEANHANNGKLKRGSLFTSYKAIQEELHWMVGYRKEKYSKWQCEIAMKLLTKATMVTTTRTTRGMIITICNYEYYQNPKNYESHNETYTKATTKPQTTDTISEEEEEEKEKKPPISPEGELPEEEKEEIYFPVPEELDTPKFRSIWFGKWVPYRRESRFKNPAYTRQGLKGTLTRLKNDSDGDVSTAIKIIQLSIDMGYQGLFPLKGGKYNGQAKKRPGGASAPAGYYDKFKTEQI